MTPEELLAACREAWPDREGSRWEAFDAPLQARREVWRLLVHVEQVVVARGARVVRGSVLTLDTQISEAPATPSGVREVVSALRAWCREEALRLLAEVDPDEGADAEDDTPLPAAVTAADIWTVTGPELAKQMARSWEAWRSRQATYLDATFEGPADKIATADFGDGEVIERTNLGGGDVRVMVRWRREP